MQISFHAISSKKTSTISRYALTGLFRPCFALFRKWCSNPLAQVLVGNMHSPEPISKGPISANIVVGLTFQSSTYCLYVCGWNDRSPWSWPNWNLLKQALLFLFIGQSKLYKFKYDELVINQEFPFLSFRRKPESSIFNTFWMPDQVRHDGFGTFYETVKYDLFKQGRALKYHLHP